MSQQDGNRKRSGGSGSDNGRQNKKAKLSGEDSLTVPDDSSTPIAEATVAQGDMSNSANTGQPDADMQSLDAGSVTTLSLPVVDSSGAVEPQTCQHHTTAATEAICAVDNVMRSHGSNAGIQIASSGDATPALFDRSYAVSRYLGVEDGCTLAHSLFMHTDRATEQKDAVSTVAASPDHAEQNDGDGESQRSVSEGSEHART